jgi:hypothetical protein
MYTFDVIMDELEPPSYELWRFAVFYEFRALESYCLKSIPTLRNFVPLFHNMRRRGNFLDWEWILRVAHRGTRDSMLSLVDAMEDLAPELGVTKLVSIDHEDEDED